jgi:hypothetical protein
MTDSIVKVGERRTFHSSLQNEDGQGILVRLYTGQTVEVIADEGEVEETDEHMMRVRADDGTEFAAWETELIDHAQSVYVMPDGTYVDDPEFTFAPD